MLQVQETGIPVLIKLSFFLLLFSFYLHGQIPETPQPQGMKPFWILQGVESATILGDDFTTRRALSLGCVEADPIYGQHPSNFRLIATGIGLQVGSAIPLYYMIKSKKRFWRILGYSLLTSESGARVEAIIHNSTFQTRNQCVH
jgi:hypothetical protein